MNWIGASKGKSLPLPAVQGSRRRQPLQERAGPGLTPEREVEEGVQLRPQIGMAADSSSM